jgi:DNA topoisomerase-1
VGSHTDTQAAKKAYGASTLEAQHIKITGNKITFDFVGKKGVQIHKTIEDAELAAFLKPRLAKGGPVFNTADGQARSYLRSVSGKGYKVKDFRTWQGTNKALETIATLPVPKTKREYAKAVSTVAKVVAEHLGNTPTVAKKAYIAPEVFAKWERFDAR